METSIKKVWQKPRLTLLTVKDTNGGSSGFDDGHFAQS